MYEEATAQCTKTLAERMSMGVSVWVYRTRTTMMMHKKADGFLVMCHGTPFLEVLPNHFILVAPPADSPHYTNRMNAILNSVLPKKKEKRHFYIKRRLSERLDIRICEYRGHKFVDHCILDENCEVIYTDYDKMQVTVDTEKVKAMQKRYRTYFKPFEVIVRLQSVEEDIKKVCSQAHHEIIIKCLDKLGIPNVPVPVDRMHRKMNEYIASGEPMSIEMASLMVLACNPYGQRYVNYSSFLEKVKKTKKALRLRFAQGCTKIMYDKYIPEETYVQYKSMVLQSVNGLRSLQIPSQAQVLGQDPGTIQAPT
jgi:hypothetical protein